MKLSAFALLASAASAYGHVVITQVVGANGVTTMGFGVTASTPRTGTTEQPFQLDTPVLKNLKDDPCGATLLSGSIDIPTALADAEAQGGGTLPSLTDDGTINLTLHQVNADGGGPFVAMVNTDATGQTWEPATVLVQAPGTNGILHGGPADVPFSAQLNAGTTCTGGTDGATCLLRLNSGGTGNTLSLAQGAGPFGGCFAVTQSTATTAAGTTATTAATTAATTTAAAAATATTATTSKKKSKAKGARFASRHFFPTLDSREKATENFRRTRVLEDLSFLAARGELTTDLIDEIKTATGTAIDIPIDNLAGQNDAADLGGNSSTAANAVLSTQQAVDLKKAVQLAIETALNVLASGGSVVAQNALDLTETDAANAKAALELEDGTLTSINAGNAGVGFFQTAVVNSLLGPLATISAVATTDAGVAAALATATVSEAVAATDVATVVTATDTAVAATATDTAAAATATATSAATTTKGRKGAKGSKKNRQSFD